MFKEKLEDYTEEEFLNFLGGLGDAANLLI